MASSRQPIWQRTHIAQHYIMLVRELVTEEVRKARFDRLPSRQTCIWASEDLGLARFWVQRLNGPAQIAELEVTGAIHRADSALLLGDSEPFSETYQNAEAYWRGDTSSKAEPEVLFAGQARVVGWHSV